MACQRVRDIRERQKSGNIQIRVLRKWILKGKKEEVCYQFCDVHGDCIEVTADAKDIDYFNSMIQLQSCYRVSGYICVGPRSYMATVDHPASLIIGQKAKFNRIEANDIPTSYFNFATYDTLKTRIRNLSLLSDYIGRVEKNGLRPTTQERRYEKLFYEMKEQEIEITFWPDKLHLIGDDVVPGDVLAISSAKVTEYNGHIQLESTHLTTAVKNPDMPQAVEHVQRLRALPAMQDIARNEPTVTLLDLEIISQQKVQSSRNFTCEATITRINDNRAWYYVFCSKCSNKLYQEHDNGNIVFVCKDDENIVPNFRYCVNATITDATASAEAVFFNESIKTMLNINCEDMVTKYGQLTSPNKVPEILESITNTPRMLHLTLKNDGQIAVNDVTNLAESSDVQSTGTASRTSTITPFTPIPVPNISKQQLLQTPDARTEKRQRRA
ncbi:hypothetical protein CASFOL_029146 [Castilleja foliolosa]|uniref:Replication factor A C-terminal domain-containing protein n=1 Tax=Castilleja foliolosa TaxID=1961234 RepID=A0ABD3CDW7_9LAMI